MFNIQTSVWTNIEFQFEIQTFPTVGLLGNYILIVNGDHPCRMIDSGFFNLILKQVTLQSRELEIDSVKGDSQSCEMIDGSLIIYGGHYYGTIDRMFSLDINWNKI
jgi:hypothetical protein